MTTKYTDEFLAFYEVYPRKVSKFEASKAFAKLDESEQRLAKTDVEKRTRMRWWSGNPRLIAMPATYLNQRRFEDEWLDDMKVRSEGEAGLEPRAKQPVYFDEGVKRDHWGIVGQRVGLKWFMASKGLEPADVDQFVKIKNDTVNELRGAGEEDVSSCATVEEAKAARYDMSITLAALLLERWDKAFGKSLGPAILSASKRAS